MKYLFSLPEVGMTVAKFIIETHDILFIINLQTGLKTMNISVKDLEINVTLDQDAMIGVLGGWHNHSSLIVIYPEDYSNSTNSGAFLVQKRYRGRYRKKLA